MMGKSICSEGRRELGEGASPMAGTAGKITPELPWGTFC